jgi:tripartite-type tricarboxylate transporter receptor subunit TctC
MTPSERRRSLTIGIFAGMALPRVSLAQADRRPLRILVGYAPGNSVDSIARMLAEKMTTSLGVPVLVENKVGAGSRIAVQALKAAPADGSTLMLSTFSVMGIFPMIFTKTTYQLADFEPVAHIANSNIVLAAPVSAPYKTIGEYAAWLKANSARAQFGNEAAGSPAHLLGIEFGRLIGVDMTFVPYQTTGQLVSDLIGNTIPCAGMAIPSVLKLHQAGQLRIMAVASEQRTPNAPDIPTFKESGFNLSLNSMYGAWMPSKTPLAAVERVSKALVEAVAAPDIQQKLRQIGLDPTGTDRAEFARISDDSVKTWSRIVKETGFRIEQ